jgi:hypothetical protein
VKAGRPDWAAEPLVACVNGPLIGQWFTLADWTARQDAARRMKERGQRPTPALDYAPTGATVSHPHVSDVSGAAWQVRAPRRVGGRP